MGPRKGLELDSTTTDTPPTMISTSVDRKKTAVHAGLSWEKCPERWALLRKDGVHGSFCTIVSFVMSGHIKR